MKKLVSLWKESSRRLARYYAYCGVALVLVIVMLAVFLPLFYGGTDRLERIGISQLLCITLTLLVILFGLIPVLRQLKISEARPGLSLGFDESGSTETTIEVTEGKATAHQLHLWMSNNGNAVAKEFQLDLDVNQTLGAYLIPLRREESKVYDPRQSVNAGMSTISFSTISVPCFVGRPLPVAALSLRTKEDSHNLYPQGIRILYRISGTWGPEQSRELRVRLNKPPSA